MKRVIVNGYTYETDLPVKLNDEVLLPTPDWLVEFKGPTWRGKVESLVSNYDGPCVQILKILSKAKK